jgi:hypothetical protein
MCLENLEKIRWINIPGPDTLLIYIVSLCKSITDSVGKSYKNPKSSNVCSHYCDKNNHNMADFREIF